MYDLKPVEYFEKLPIINISRKPPYTVGAPV